MGEELSGQSLHASRPGRGSMISSVLPTLKTLPMRLVVADKRGERADDVADVREAPRLRAVAEYGDGLAGQRLPDEARHDHPVTPRLARADGVEEPHDDHRAAASPSSRPGPGTRRSPCCTRRPTGASIVGPSTRSPSSRNGTASLLPYTSDVDATKTSPAASWPRLQHHLRAVHVGLDGPHRGLDDEPHAHRGSQVDTPRRTGRRARPGPARSSPCRSCSGSPAGPSGGRCCRTTRSTGRRCTITWWPSPSRASARWDPMKPAPPVISTRIPAPLEQPSP